MPGKLPRSSLLVRRLGKGLTPFEDQGLGIFGFVAIELGARGGGEMGQDGQEAPWTRRMLWISGRCCLEAQKRLKAWPSYGSGRPRGLASF